MSAIPVSELGLNSSESRYLQQQIAASQQGSNSSRAASHASSQGRLLLDPTSLQALSAHFDRLMYSIQQRWHYVSAPEIASISASLAKLARSMVPVLTQPSSRSKHKRRPRCSTTARVTRSRWPTPKSPASVPSSAKSTSCKSSSTKCGALEKLSRASSRA